MSVSLVDWHVQIAHFFHHSQLLTYSITTSTTAHRNSYFFHGHTLCPCVALRRRSRHYSTVVVRESDSDYLPLFPQLLFKKQLLWGDQSDSFENVSHGVSSLSDFAVCRLVLAVYCVIHGFRVERLSHFIKNVTE